MLFRRVFVRTVGLCLLLGAVAPTGVSAYVFNNYKSYAVPSVSRPACTLLSPDMCKSTPIVDPVFGDTVTRVTDPSMSPKDGTNLTLGLRHEYARYPALNANNTQVVVLVRGGLWRGFYEVRDLSAKGIRVARIRPVGDPEFSWHPTDPTVLFYRYGSQIRLFHINPNCINVPLGVTCRKFNQTAYDNGGWIETVMAFDGTNGLPKYYSIGTSEEGRPSDNWHYYAFIGYTNSSLTSGHLVVADLWNKRLIAKRALSSLPNWVGMSPRGTGALAIS